MTSEHDVLLLRLARYGVPAVILVFYLTATQQFEYTPESVFVALSQVVDLPVADSGGFTSPLWTGLLMGARSAGIDPLLAAKVLSLLFAGMAIQTTFLIAMEIHRGLFPALSAVLMFAVQSWLVQVAVSGHPFVFGLVLVLGALFFLQRNEYPLSAILIGLSMLVFWQAVFLVPILAGDAVVNSAEKGTGIGRAIRAAATAFGVPALWVAIASATGKAIIPVMPAFPELQAPKPWTSLLVGLMTLGAVTGMIIILLRGEKGRRIFLALTPPIATILFMGMASFSANPELWRVGLPLIFTMGLFGVRLLVEQSGRVLLLFPVLVLLVGLTLVQNQMEMYSSTRYQIARTAAENRELAGIAVWIRAHAAPDDQISSERPAVLSYYLGRPVRPLEEQGTDASDLVVAVRPPAPGTIPLYRLPSVPDAPDVPGVGYAVWRKR